MVNYRREQSYGYVQTYPLPTPSMVRGMAHALLDLKKYCPLRISIQGKYASIVTNMQKVYKFDRVRDDSKKGVKDKRPRLYAGGEKTLNRGVQFVDEIVDMELLLHVAFDEDALNQRLLDTVKQKTIVLGRNEDIANVDYDETKLVDVIPADDEYRLKYNIYLKPDLCRSEQIAGTHYRLPFYYEDVTSFDDKRIFKFVDAVYVAGGHKIQYSNVDKDSEGDFVSFLSV